MCEVKNTLYLSDSFCLSFPLLLFLSAPLYFWLPVFLSVSVCLSPDFSFVSLALQTVFYPA